MQTIQATQTISLDQLRQLKKYTGHKFRETVECLTKATKDDPESLIQSFKEGYIEPNEYIQGDFFKHEDHYYSEDNYCITLEGDLCDKDNANFCDYFQEYTSTGSHVNIGRREQFYSDSAIEDADLHYYQGNYYDEDALSRNNLVLMNDGTAESMDDVFWNEETGQYQYQPVEQVPIYLRSYHNGRRTNFVDFSDNVRFRIGYEIEKEDLKVLQSIEIDEFEEKCPKWRKEEDGSLHSETGYELISPAYELNTAEIEKDIKANPVILAHVNAHTNTKRCGGHINVSETGLTGLELFERMKGYTPLFYALYYKRIDKRYSKGKSNKDLKTGYEQDEKYQAIRIHREHLEYRIISAVPNLETLLWRTELFNLLLNNQTDRPLQALFNCHTILKSHLSIMYPNHRFNTLMQRMIKFTADFEGIDLNNPNQPTE